MCGIVGHIGHKNAVEIVIEGLKRLEYRGYDSSGISFINLKNEHSLYKKEGKIANLLDLISNKKLDARIAIGHTRWATHGEVSDSNAHPHIDGNISLVHNGIIENHIELKAKLQQEFDYTFESDTDSEVFLALIRTSLDLGNITFFDAVTESFKKITGNSAFVILNSDTREIIAIKRSAPLVCGVSHDRSDIMVSSDPYALLGFTPDIYFPEDEVICYLKESAPGKILFYELDGLESKRYLHKRQEGLAEVAQKGEFEHFMLKEIYEQPKLIRDLINYYFNGEGRSSLESLNSFKVGTIHIAACGTAAYAGAVIRDFIEEFNRKRATIELASEFRYRNPLLEKGDVGLFISQSGETADTLAAQELCKKHGIMTSSIVNVDGSTLFRECDKNFLIKAGVEIGVASTKAFTQQILTGRLFSFALNGLVGNSEKEEKLKKKMSLLACRIDEVLKNSKHIKIIAEEIYNKKGFFYTGRGRFFPVALEGALKLKEIAYVHAEGYAAGELKHGPIALIDEEMVNIAIVGTELYDKTVSNIQEIKSRKGIIVTIGPEGDEALKEISDYFIPLKFDGLEELSPLYVNVVNQLLAYYMALFKGTDIDKPRNLAKSVTVE